MRFTRTSIVLTFAALANLLLPVHEGHAQSFKSLPEATQFLDKVLAEDDRKQLQSALIAPEKSRFSQCPSFFGTLRHEWKRTGAFTKLYEAREFPAAGDSFTLGGHDSELGHVHIVFAREGPAWKLNDIWLCR